MRLRLDNNPKNSMAEDSSDNPLGLLLDAVNFATIKHKDQRRKDPSETPYINHPIGVAHILWKEGGITDLATLQAAVLHDTVEDTDTSYDELDDQFGEEVRVLVSEVSDDKSLAKEERKRLQILNAPSKSYKARLIKLGDKLYNFRDLERATPCGWSEQRVQEYFEWGAKVVRGILGTNDNLEKAIEQVLKKRGVSLYTDDPDDP